MTVPGGWLAAFLALTATEAPPKSLWVYVGTYTGDGSTSKGIYRFALDLADGKLGEPELVAETESPSFLSIHPNGKALYAVAEVSEADGKPGGALAAFAIDPRTGALSPLNKQSTRGGYPCFVGVDPAGKVALAANYGGGSVSSYPIAADGKLGEAATFIQHEGSSVDRARQEKPHAHSINADAAGRFAIAADLGLDKLLVYRIDPAAGTLAPNDPPFARVAPGSGPRHFAFHPDGKHAYVINEMLLTVTAFDWDAEKGALSEIQTISTIPDDVTDRKGLSTAEVQVHPSGKFLYGSNRGHDTIAAYKIDQATGKLARIENEPTGGKTPRNFGIDPTGQYLLAANQDSNTIVAFKIDQETGELTPTGQEVAVPKPVCVKFLAPAAKP